MCTSRNSYKLDEDQAIQLGICSKLFKLQLAFDNMAISKPLHVDGKKVIETVLLLYEIKKHIENAKNCKNSSARVYDTRRG